MHFRRILLLVLVIASLGCNRVEHQPAAATDAATNPELLSEADSARLIQQAAEQDDPAAWFRVAELYRQGHGVDPDPVEAVIWWRKAADVGYADAEYALAAAREQGVGVEQDDNAALRL